MITRNRAPIGTPAFVLSVALVFAGCASDADPEVAGGATPREGTDGPALEAMAPITLTVSEPLSANASNFRALQEFMDQVTEASDGKITFDVYTDSSLHPITEGLSALNSGLTDITLFSPPLSAEQVPSTMWATGLGVYTFGSTPQQMLAGSPAFVKTLLESEDISKNLADNGAILLSTWVSEGYSLLCTKPIHSLADAQGVLVRTPGRPFSDEVEALGMTNVFLENREVYEGLQRGVIDCNYNVIPTYMNDGLWEFAHYWLPVPGSSSVGVGYIMSKESWESLPPVAQEIIDEAKSAIAANFLKFTAEADKRWFDEARDMGVEFIDVPKEMIDIVENVQEERGNAVTEGAPDVVTDPQDEIDSIQRYHDEWLGILAEEFGVDQQSDTPEHLLDALDSTSDNVDWDRYQELFTQFLLESD